MAVQKPYPSVFGVTFTYAYWVISDVIFNRIHRSIEVQVSVCIDAEARQSGCTPVATIACRIPGEQYDAVIAGGVTVLYEALKANELAGGIDV